LQLIHNLETVLQLSETDMTIFFRNLSKFKSGNPLEGLEVVSDAFYNPKDISDTIRNQWNTWFEAYSERLKNESISDEERTKNMNAVSPKYVRRNYMAQLAIDEADKGNYHLIDELFQLLKRP